MKKAYFIYSVKAITEVGKIQKYEVTGKIVSGYRLTNGSRLRVGDSQVWRDFSKAKTRALTLLQNNRDSTVKRLEKLDEAIAFVQSQTEDNTELSED